jgi:hypothetical protein
VRCLVRKDSQQKAFLASWLRCVEHAAAWASDWLRDYPVYYARAMACKLDGKEFRWP